MPPTTTNLANGVRKAAQDRQAKIDEQNARRTAILKKNAAKAVKLSNKALKAIQELIALENTMQAEAPDTEVSFNEGCGLSDAEHAVGVIRHYAERLIGNQ